MSADLHAELDAVLPPVQTGPPPAGTVARHLWDRSNAVRVVREAAERFSDEWAEAIAFDLDPTEVDQ